MPYCNACGKYIREGLLCPYCARVAPDDERYPVPDPEEADDAVDIPPVGEEPEKRDAGSGSPMSGGDAADPAPGLNATLRRAYAKILDTEDTTDRFSPRDVRAHRTMAALSYLGILWAIPFFFARSSRFVRFHLGQGLLLLLADGIAATLLGLTLLMNSLAPAVCPALAAVTEIIAFLSIVLKICGVTYAMRGRARELPLIGACADAG